MAELSPGSSAIASNTVQFALREIASALAAMPLSELAVALGKDETTVCRIRSGETKVLLEDAVRLIYAVGKKLVDKRKHCVDRARYEALVTMASAAMADEQTVRRLTWDE